MKLSNSFVTASFAALALAGATVLSSANSAQAMGLRFTPAGSAVNDGDDIRDLVKIGGTSVTFDLLFDTNGLNKDEDIVENVVIDFGFDSDELIPPPTVTGAVLGVATIPDHIYSVAFSGLSLMGDDGYKPLGSLKFNLASILPNDGKRDFFATLRTVTGKVAGRSNDFMISEALAGNNIQKYQQVEVQSATAVPTPALLPGLAALGFGAIRKRKAKAAVA
jgi:hypothetical protein